VTVEQGRLLLAQAKGRLRAFRALAFFDAAHRELNREPNDGLPWMERWPHVSFLIAKWAFANWRPNDDRPEPSPDDLNFVAQSTFDAIGQLHRVDGNPAIFIRRMAQQQIWLQRSFDASSIPRQFRILGELMVGAEAMVRFQEQFGLPAAEFAVQLAHMAADAGDMLQIESMSELRPVTPRNPEHWLLVRAHLNRTVPALHQEMAAFEARGTAAEVEVCEQSPLVRTPFLEARNVGPVCIHHTLLFRCLESVLFDLARSIDPRPFMNDFGPAFENYLAEVLSDLNGQVIREGELRRRLIGEGQVVDFALVSDDALVLIDAKGIEGHYDELYHNLPAELAARLRTSLLRAVDQAISTVNRLPPDLQRPAVYFLCVTFKQVVVTDGIALRELTTGTDQWAHERWSSHVLSPVRMFFPSIYEFESLVALATTTRVPLNQLIREFSNDNSDNNTRKMYLEQHVAARHVPLVAPTVVQEAAARLRR
jgi:hypothetical protein